MAAGTIPILLALVDKLEPWVGVLCLVLSLAVAWVLERRQPESRVARGEMLILQNRIAEEPDKFFLGRDKEKLEEYAEKIETNRVVFLTGESGVGKSTFLEHGVLPMLRNRGVVLPIYVKRYDEDPSVGPMLRFSSALRAHSRSVENLAGFSARDPKDFAKTLDASIDALGQERKLCLVFDQFEDYLLSHSEFFEEGDHGFEARDIGALKNLAFWEIVSDRIASASMHCLFCCQREHRSLLDPLRGLTEPESFRPAKLKNLPPFSFTQLLNELVDAPGVLEFPENGWPKLKELLSKHIEEASNFNAAKFAASVRGLSFLPNLTVDSYIEAGGLDGLPSLEVKHAVERAAKRCDVAPHLVRKALVELVEGGDGGRGSRSLAELALVVHELPAATLEELLGVLVDKGVVEEDELRPGHFRLEHYRKGEAVLYVEREASKSRWQLDEAADAFRASRGLAVISALWVPGKLKSAVGAFVRGEAVFRKSWRFALISGGAMVGTAGLILVLGLFGARWWFDEQAGKEIAATFDGDQALHPTEEAALLSLQEASVRRQAVVFREFLSSPARAGSYLAHWQYLHSALDDTGVPSRSGFERAVEATCTAPETPVGRVLDACARLLTRTGSVALRPRALAKYLLYSEGHAESLARRTVLFASDPELEVAVVEILDTFAVLPGVGGSVGRGLSHLATVPEVWVLLGDELLARLGRERKREGLEALCDLSAKLLEDSDERAQELSARVLDVLSSRLSTAAGSEEILGLGSCLQHFSGTENLISRESTDQVAAKLLSLLLETREPTEQLEIVRVLATVPKVDADVNLQVLDHLKVTIDHRQMEPWEFEQLAKLASRFEVAVSDVFKEFREAATRGLITASSQNSRWNYAESLSVLYRASGKAEGLDQLVLSLLGMAQREPIESKQGEWLQVMASFPLEKISKTTRDAVYSASDSWVERAIDGDLINTWLRVVNRVEGQAEARGQGHFSRLVNNAWIRSAEGAVSWSPASSIVEAIEPITFERTMPTLQEHLANVSTPSQLRVVASMTAMLPKEMQLGFEQSVPAKALEFLERLMDDVDPPRHSPSFGVKRERLSDAVGASCSLTEGMDESIRVALFARLLEAGSRGYLANYCLDDLARHGDAELIEERFLAILDSWLEFDDIDIRSRLSANMIDLTGELGSAALATSIERLASQDSGRRYACRVAISLVTRKTPVSHLRLVRDTYGRWPICNNRYHIRNKAEVELRLREGQGVAQ